jgi:hypothetical protein
MVALPRRALRTLRDRAIASLGELAGEARGEPRANAEELVHQAEGTFGPSPESLPSIRLFPERQLEILDRMRPFEGDLRRGARLEPSSFDAASAYTLELAIRVIRPRHILEVGSGPVASALFDALDRAGGTIDVTFVEPTLSRLRRFLRPEDHGRYRAVSNLTPELPSELAPNDLLVVEPSRMDEVERLLFEIVPALPSGAFACFPVRYPFTGAPLIRAFLAHNDAFQIRFWPSYLYQHRRDALARIGSIASDVPLLFVRKVA